jgi:hypothetical protein
MTRHTTHTRTCPGRQHSRRVLALRLLLPPPCPPHHLERDARPRGTQDRGVRALKTAA